ncbi:MAG: hypothetical protein GPOALKHO_001949 [Sodalis sp.]|uniref:hypothetical protein n=1 Tax=Sodalis sp. (in: enterobacteria) TaxID=1898979 RepID=UPI0038732134|nr:MAG: hypothetical protein GPOALKHO_001949 [Sodalis sp.]
MLPPSLVFTALGLLDYLQRFVLTAITGCSLALILCHQCPELQQSTATGTLSQSPGWRISVIEISCDRRAHQS